MNLADGERSSVKLGSAEPTPHWLLAPSCLCRWEAACWDWICSPPAALICSSLFTQRSWWWWVLGSDSSLALAFPSLSDVWWAYIKVSLSFPRAFRLLHRLLSTWARSPAAGAFYRVFSFPGAVGRQVSGNDCGQPGLHPWAPSFNGQPFGFLSALFKGSFLGADLCLSNCSLQNTSTCIRERCCAWEAGGSEIPTDKEAQKVIQGLFEVKETIR